MVTGMIDVLARPPSQPVKDREYESVFFNTSIVPKASGLNESMLEYDTV